MTAAPKVTAWPVTDVVFDGVKATLIGGGVALTETTVAVAELTGIVRRRTRR